MPRLNNPSLAHAAAHAEQPDAHPGEMQKRRGGQGAFPDLRLRWKFGNLYHVPTDQGSHGMPLTFSNVLCLCCPAAPS